MAGCLARRNLFTNLNNTTMTAFIEKNLNDLKESLRNTQPVSVFKAGPSDQSHSGSQSEKHRSDALKADEEKAGILILTIISNLSPGPGDEDDDDDLDDDDLLDDDDDDTLIPIQGDEEDDDFLSADEDDDVVPGTDMDDGDDLLDDDSDDLDDDDSGVNRSTMGDMGSNVTGRNDGRTTGRMIDHEPGTGGI